VKFVIRRIAFGIITAPIVVAIYAVGYGLLSLVVDQPLFPQADILWLIAVMYVLCLVFAKQISKMVSWFTD
jgi:hypothetical protein